MAPKASRGVVRAAMLAACFLTDAAAQEVATPRSAGQESARGQGMQESATAADIQGLRDAVFEARTDLARLRTGDADLLKTLRTELDTTLERITAFETTLRVGFTVSRLDYIAARNRIADVRRRARGELTVSGAGLGPGASAPDPASVPVDRLEIPPRTQLKFQLLTAVDPRVMRVDDRVEATTLKPIVAKGKVLVPAGSLIRGVVDSIAPGSAGGTARTLTVRFGETTVNARSYRIQATATIGRALEPGAVLRTRFH